MVPRLVELLGAWQRPADLPAWIALGLAGYLALRAIVPQHAPALSRARFLTLAAFAAAFLSLGYVAHYLRGGPRIIDATSYFMQGRAMSHGLLSWSVPEVSASFRGRFLLFHEPDHLAGIFPPGYPLLLSLGFLVGAPMVIGPVLAAALVLATYALAREMAHGHPDQERIARLAAVVSIFCAALRYHTADTMSHGAAALAVAIALASALAARRRGTLGHFALAGLMVGWALSTRVASGLPIGALVFALAYGAPRRARAIGWTLAFALPGLLLLFASQRAATGSFFQSPQLTYYATSDGPPGCFRYGFGGGIGCVFEHEDFVKARLQGGYGLVAALGTTLRRLRMHLTDVVNFEPVALLVLLPRSRAARLGQLAVVGQILAYAPFYFDGNYPGGGARFFADVLPIEHALVALAVAGLWPKIDFVRREFALLALAALGFAVHASHAHRALADRDGGRPMFEPDKLREAGIATGLVFFDTDHGYNLAFDPAAVANRGVVAARLRGDDHDRLLHARLGHPPASVYKFGNGDPTLTRMPAAGSLNDATWKFDAEAEWPALRQSGGWAAPAWVPSGRVLALHASPIDGDARAILELPVPRTGRWRVRPTVVHRGTGGIGALSVFHAQDRPLATWSWKDAELDRTEHLPEQIVDLVAPRAFVRMTTNREISVDYIIIETMETPH